MNEQVFKNEQFYLPAKFVPPFGIGDRYTFPNGEIWKISGIEIESLTAHHARITISWRRPLHPDDEWFGTHRHRVGDDDDNWLEGATATRLWE